MSYDITLRTKVDADELWRIGTELHDAARDIRMGFAVEAAERIERLGDVNAALVQTEVYDWNTTWNYAPMFEAMFGHHISEFVGKSGKEVGPCIRNAISLMVADPKRYKVFDAPNGWGTYDQLLPQLEAFAAACEAHPNAIVEVT